MIVFKGRRTIYIDVDDTLVIWGSSDELMPFNNNGMVESLKPNEEIINYLKERSRAGDCIIVWTQNGGEWAEEVVRKLGLEDYVDLCLPKCDEYVDDLHCSNWMKNWKKV